MTQYAYEYGKRWNAKTPRDLIGYRIDKLRVSTADSEIERLITSAIDSHLERNPALAKDWTKAIRNQCVRYALERHHRNQSFYMFVMGSHA